MPDEPLDLAPIKARWYAVGGDGAIRNPPPDWPSLAADFLDADVPALIAEIERLRSRRITLDDLPRVSEEDEAINVFNAGGPFGV